ncbi:MAG: hypothetical protein IJ400_07295 [Clostridia bacterium]|nr:hypothetical protein [Clostridia bacterium]
MKLTYDNRMAIAGHRGDCYNYYENTMTAFKMALENGADMIETDVRLTKDLVPVLIHDDTTNRTGDKKCVVADTTFQELRQINVGDQRGPEIIPTLEELLEWTKDTKLTLNLEIKEYYSEQNQKRAEECIEKTIALVEKYGLGQRIVINSFDAFVLEYVYKKYGKKYLLHGFYPYYELGNKTINPDEYLYCACIFEWQKKEHYDYLISKGIEPWVGAGVTQISKLEACLDYGAKLITTNNPRDIKEKLENINGQK